MATDAAVDGRVSRRSRTGRAAWRPPRPHGNRAVTPGDQSACAQQQIAAFGKHRTRSRTSSVQQ